LSYPPIGGSFNGMPPKAPRKFRMSKIFCGALGTALGPGGSAPLTYLCMFPIEAPCFAARLLFTNYRADTTMTIASASIYPSDSYSVALAMNADRQDVGSVGRWSPVPTGGAAGSKVYFDNAGADVSTINASGTLRDITIGPVTANTGNGAWPYTYTCSDWIPITSIPRADGGTQPVLFVYVTVSSAQMIGPVFYNGAFTANTEQNRGRYIVSGVAWDSNVDYADNPTGTGFKATNAFGPLCGIQYMTTAPGVTLLITGDSLSSSPPVDNYSTALLRAAWDLSSTSIPIEVSNIAWGGTASATYGLMYDNNLSIIQPGIVAFQPQSRNDGTGRGIEQVLLAKALIRANTARNSFGALTLWHSPGCIPSILGSPSAIQGYQNMRASLALSAANGGIANFDATGIIGMPGSEYLYINSLVSDDNTHPNSTGVEMTVPRAREVLLSMIS
jgi:hypothetical protein